MINKFFIFLFFAVAVFFLVGCMTDRGGEAASGPKAMIFKSTSCGCCDIYSGYMDARGFDVEVENLQSVDPIKEQYNIPAGLRSCHTTVVDGYFIEGHIPSEAIDKLLLEKPDIAGIAMAGMPSGSPGMLGGKTGDFVIQAVHKDGSVTEFMRI